jgi:ABC-type multidrug transport system fused ATPase/permease subunit
MDQYTALRAIQQTAIKKLKQELNILSFLRLFTLCTALFSGYYLYVTGNQTYLYIGLVAIVVFLVLLRFYDKKATIKKHKEAIVAINTDELAFLNGEKIPFDDGIECTDVHHEYAYDLDIFGHKSLFQNLNRTYTYIGKKTLAASLLKQLPNENIVANQEAVKELTQKIEWRQDFMANAKLGNDEASFYTKLLAWSKDNNEELPWLTTVLSFVLPLVFITLFVTDYLVDTNDLSSYIFISFLINLGFAFKHVQRIKQENEVSTAIDKIVKQYGLMIHDIEEATFKAPKLVALQSALKTNSDKASVALQKLSKLFSILDSVANPLVSVLLNGMFLYHLHSLKAIIAWKNKNAKQLENWLSIIGEFEMLNSLANFSYNNPEFTFPTLNTKHEVRFENLSHPLLNAKNRVANTVSFQPQSFIILTGSNMSGKSTFLRSLGVNMVLAGMGSVVCATAANIHPMPILVSMRLSDSLSDSESYFYAEIKRLKQIMDALENQCSFVLLDEILRGTNSDDKRSGTVEVIKKMMTQKAIGAIATHDIEVCLLADESPEALINKCFEVEINNDDLHFDYTLRNGICKNKSATFLMKKIGVI